MDTRGRTLKSWWLLVAAVPAVTALTLPASIQNKLPDFEVYWTAAARASRAEPLYRASDEHYQFKYLPAFAIGMMPLAALPLPVAKRVWFGISVALLVLLLGLSLRLLPKPLRLPSWVIVTVSILSLAKFYAHELVLGQTNILFAVMALVSLSQLRQRHDVAAGALLAAMVVVKPYGLMFLPYLVVRRRPQAVMGFLIILALAVAIPALWYGFPGTVDLLRGWWSTVSSSTEPNLTNQDNISIPGMYAKWLGASAGATWLSVGTSGLLVVVCAGAVVKSAPIFPEYLEIALLLTAIPLLSPQGWDYVLLLSTPAVMMLVDSLPRLPRPLRIATLACLATIGLTLYDLMGRAAYARVMAISLITLCYGVLVGGLAYLRFRRIR